MDDVRLRLANTPHFRRMIGHAKAGDEHAIIHIRQNVSHLCQKMPVGLLVQIATTIAEYNEAVGSLNSVERAG